MVAVLVTRETVPVCRFVTSGRGALTCGWPSDSAACW